MQPLGEEARGRLVRFESFIQDRAAKNLTSTQSDLDSLLSTLRKAALLPMDETLGSELEPECPGVQARISALIEALSAAHKEILGCIDREVPCSTAAVDSLPLNDLKGIESSLQARVEKLKAPVDLSEGQKLQARIDELNARKTLIPHKEMLTAHLANLTKAANFAELASQISSGTITTKGKALTTEAMEGRYGQALKKELEAMQCRFLPLGFKLAASKGKASQRIQFSDIKGNHSPELVLSEGEQRVAALAAFLAEVQLLPMASGIILDDPVSSLDHRWASRIAKRLVEEAKNRQVVIFTHNLSFLWDLVDSAKLASPQVLCEVKTVSSMAKQPGHLHDGVPYEGEKAEARMKVLEEMIQKARALFESNPDGDEYRKLHHQFFARLRGTWERTVEELLFGGVVRRFQNSVKTQSLTAVQVGDRDHQAVYRGMTIASRHIDAHDHAEDALSTLPTPDEMAEELKALRTYLTDLKKDQKEVRNRRDVWEKGFAGSTT
jgi:hypothetical protein